MPENTLEQREEEMEFQGFMKWEKASRDTIDFKTLYVDMTGDLIAGLLLSQIIYWHLPDKDGKTKLRVQKDGKLWLAKGHADWWAEIRISEKQARRALDILKEKGLIETAIYKFNAFPTTHIYLNRRRFMEVWNEALDALANGSALQGETVLPHRAERSAPQGESITETTNRDNEQRVQTTTTKVAAVESSSSSSLNSQKGRLKQLLSELDIVDPTISELSENPKVTGELLAFWLEPYNRWKETGKGFEGIKNVQGFIVASLRRGNMPFQEPSAVSDPYGFNQALEEREREAERDEAPTISDEEWERKYARLYRKSENVHDRAAEERAAPR